MAVRGDAFVCHLHDLFKMFRMYTTLILYIPLSPVTLKIYIRYIYIWFLGYAYYHVVFTFSSYFDVYFFWSTGI
jgi:hypothetical protein